MLFLSIRLVWVLSGTFASSYSGTEYYQFDTCGAGKALKPEHRNKELIVQSTLHCGLLCAGDAACKSFDYDADHHTCYLGSLAVGQDCQRMVTYNETTQHYEEDTGCGYSLQADGSSQCPPAFSGPGCCTRMQDCSDWGQYVEDDDVKWIWPQNAPYAFQVSCRKVKDNKMRTMLMRHDEGNVSFHRTWLDYSLGFGSLSGDHWLGLQYMHYLTENRNYTLRFKVTPRTFPEHESYYLTYEVVHIGNADSNYALTTSALKNSNVPIEDCLHPNLTHTAFTTYDMDNAMAPGNCATLFGGGWWFNGTAGCASCNPTGRLLGAEGTQAEAFWANKTGEMVPLSTINMFLLR